MMRTHRRADPHGCESLVGNKSKKYRVCVVKSMSPQPTSQYRRLIRDGSVKKMAFEGRLEGLVVEVPIACLAAYFRVIE